MNRAKKITALLLSLILVLLVGCSKAPTQPEPAEEERVEPVGFVEMDIKREYLQNASYIQSKDDLIFFYTSVYKDENGELQMTHGEGEDEKYECVSCVVKYDAYNNKLLDIFEIKDCPITEIWGIELQGDKLVIYSNSEKKNAFYDYDMNLLEVTDRVVSNPVKEAKKSKFYAPSFSTVNEGYCYIEGTMGNYYFYYLNDLETAYICNSEDTVHTSAICIPEDLVLNEWFSRDASVSNFSVENYKTATRLNEASIDAKEFGYDYTSTGSTGIGNKYVICHQYFNKGANEDYTSKMFFWNYRNEQTNEKINAQKTTDFEESNNALINEIETNYGIDISVNEENEHISHEVKCDEPPSPITLYDDLHTIIAFLETLPEGMIEEIYSGFNINTMYSEGENKHGIRINLVSEITYEASAFAQSGFDPMELCFAFNTVTIENVSHEFMHLFEERIKYSLGGSDNPANLINDWDEYNKGFIHEYQYDEETHPSYDFDESNFVSEYSTTDGGEDRAELFSYLYCNAGQEKEKLKNEGINKKAQHLLELIRNAFPSVAKTDKAYWEK